VDLSAAVAGSLMKQGRNGKSTHITNPGGEIRHNQRFASRTRSKTAFSRLNPAKVAARAYFRNFGKRFNVVIHSGKVLSGFGMNQVHVG